MLRPREGPASGQISASAWSSSNERPARVVGLLPGGELLDRGFVGLVVLLALRIGRRARLVAERKAERRTAARGLGWRLAIGGTRQRQDDGCGHDNSHAQVSLRRWRRGARNPRLRS